LRVKKDWVPTDFSTFCPEAIVEIGRLPDIVEDRSIPIQLKRNLPSEECSRFRKRKVIPQAAELRVRTATWANQNVASLTGAEPEIPPELNDRQQDVCDPLIAIDDVAGDQWPERARQALIALLADVRACFLAGEVHDGHRRSRPGPSTTRGMP